MELAASWQGMGVNVACCLVKEKNKYKDQRNYFRKRKEQAEQQEKYVSEEAIDAANKVKDLMEGLILVARK
jgi:cell division protein ZapA (FtsZ GTPase activity inhibitor)